MKTTTEQLLTSNEAVPATPGVDSPQRRRAIIYEKNAPVELEILPGPSPRMGARVMEISQGGIRVWLKSRIERDTEVKVQLLSDAVISGKVRYSRRRGAGFDAAIVIQDVTCGPEGDDEQEPHIECAELALYLVGKLLSRKDVVRVKGHLSSCRTCRILLAEIHVALFGPEARR